MLTDKEELLAHEYLVDLNQTRAYMRVYPDALYNSAKTESSKAFTNPNLRSRIRELMDLRSKDTLVDAKYVLENLIAIAEKCQQEEPVMVWNPDTKQMEETGEYKFDSIGANKALELIGKHLAIFTDKTEVKNTGGIKIITGKDIDEPTDGLSVTTNNA